jgi:hypothetical protein
VRFALKVVIQNEGEPVDLNLSTNLRRRASFTLRQLYPLGKNRHDCWIRDSACSKFGLSVAAIVKFPDTVVQQIATLPTELRLKNAINDPFLSGSLPTDFYWDIILQPPLLSYLLPTEFCHGSNVNDPFILYHSISVINYQLSCKLCRLLTTGSLKTRDQ